MRFADAFVWVIRVEVGLFFDGNNHAFLRSLGKRRSSFQVRGSGRVSAGPRDGLLVFLFVIKVYLRIHLPSRSVVAHNGLDFVITGTGSKLASSSLVRSTTGAHAELWRGIFS